MAKKLTAGVLKGTAYRENFKVEWQGEEYEVEIRPLNNQESLQVQELLQEGITIKAKPSINGQLARMMDFDTKANLRGRAKADVKTVELGTIDETITQDVVEKEFPPKLVSEIANRIRQISGIGNQQEVEEFNEGKENPSNEE